MLKCLNPNTGEFKCTDTNHPWCEVDTGKCFTETKKGEPRTFATKVKSRKDIIFDSKTKFFGPKDLVNKHLEALNILKRVKTISVDQTPKYINLSSESIEFINEWINNPNNIFVDKPSRFKNELVIRPDTKWAPLKNDEDYTNYELKIRSYTDLISSLKGKTLGGVKNFKDSNAFIIIKVYKELSEQIITKPKTVKFPPSVNFFKPIKPIEPTEPIELSDSLNSGNANEDDFDENEVTEFIFDETDEYDRIVNKTVNNSFPSILIKVKDDILNELKNLPHD